MHVLWMLLARFEISRRHDDGHLTAIARAAYGRNSVDARIVDGMQIRLPDRNRFLLSHRGPSDDAQCERYTETTESAHVSRDHVCTSM